MTKQKILIIDDEIDYGVIMRGYFRAKNYDVTLAFSLNKGLETLDKLNPDILFLDNNLPDGNGWDNVDMIVEKYPHLKIYLVSAYFQKGEFTHPSSHVVIWEKPLSMSLLNETF